MAILEAETFLTQSRDVRRAFEIPKRKYPTIRSDREIRILLHKDDLQSKNLLTNAAGDFFTTAVAYLANRTDNLILEDIGTEMWKAINQKRILIMLAENTLTAAIYLMSKRGIEFPFDKIVFQNESIRKALQGESIIEDYDDPEPWVLFVAQKQDFVVTTWGYTLLTPHFVDLSIKHPHLALATAVSLGSQIRDFATERFGLESSETIQTRARVVEAQFLLNTFNQDNKLSFNIPPYKEVFEKYPQGLETPNLPGSIKYLSSDSKGKDLDRN